MSTSSRSIAAAVVAAAMLLAGCSSGKDAADPEPSKSVNPLAAQSADELFAGVQKVLAKRDPLRVVGTLKDGKNDVEFAVTYSGSDARGRIRSGDIAFRFIRVGKMEYLNADRDFWSGPAGTDPQATSLFANHWVTGDDFKGLTADMDRTALFKELQGPGISFQRGKDQTVNGIRCFTLTDRDGDDTASIAIDQRQGRPVRIAVSNPASSFTFSYENLTLPRTPAHPVDVEDTVARIAGG